MHIDTTELSHVHAAGQARHDIYRKIHKAVRLTMADLLVRAGQLDPNDPAAVQDLCARLATFADLCAHHLEMENIHIHAAMEARAPGSSERIAGEHVQHEHDIARLREHIGQLAQAAPEARAALAHALYHELSLFIAHNLVHMYVEETANNNVLWRQYTDQDIQAIEGRLIADVPPETMAGVLRLMLPAINPQERLDMLGGVKQQAPREVYRAQLQIAREALPSPAWLQLASALDEPVDVWGAMQD